MINAISSEFSDSIHCLCLFHIDLNLKKNLRNKLDSDEFQNFCANSTQHVKSLNQKVHDCIKSNSSLLELVKEIQDLLDKKSEYVRMEEYKDQIPMVRLATVPKTFFKSIEIIVSQYLLLRMVFVVYKQQKQELENVEFDIRNPVIITQKGRPPERVKSTIEIQDK
ncbi:8584_t:CDS:2 [Funneliformis geosporum]|uniref:8584_t:CDS:1 n=1 Tax=Funneliformis geosporum TaxID=1117311 RepID=A0A9W4WQD8_9GLOM|nr:8584_t:CDS:2 [Funneliformis geosporum]